MIDLKNIHLVFELLNYILIIDEKNNIVYTGDSIVKVLFESDSQDELVFLNNFSQPEERHLWEKKINEVRRNKRPSSLKIERIQKTLFLFPVNLNETQNVIISTREKILQTSKMESDLKERIKELQCLYTIGTELDSNERVSQTLPNCIEPLIDGFQFPEFTTVRIDVDGKIFGNKNIDRLQVKKVLSQDIVVNKIKRGVIEVFYLQRALFLEEEKKLMVQIASMIARALEKQDLKVELQIHLEKLEDLVMDLEKQKKILLLKNKKLLELTEECGKSRNQLESLFNAITDTIVVIDADFNIHMSNKSEIGNSGKCYQRIFNEISPCADCPAVKSFKEGRSVSVEKIVGNEYFLLNNYPILNNLGQVENILEICSNVTIEKQMEFQLLQSYKLASLGKLVAGVAHEINNPNTFIMGNIKIIKESFDDIFPITDQYFSGHDDLQIARLNYKIFKESIPVLLNDMVEGANRIKKIVDGLRNFAKKDDESFEENVDINQVIQNSTRLVENQIRKTAKVRLKLDPELPDIKGNIQKLEQVVVNMLINASQAIENSRGIIDIETRFDRKNEEIVIFFRDNGKGIDEKSIKSIFDPFFTTKRDKGGTGLGLSISYGIIKDHDGRIEVDSMINQGTTFTIHIPIHEEAKP
jgi:signal transduction histidine kinase